MINHMTPQKIYQVIKDFPEDALFELSNFIDFIKFKYESKSNPKFVKLGGALAENDVDISEEDIKNARKEMWHNLGDVIE